MSVVFFNLRGDNPKWAILRLEGAEGSAGLLPAKLTDGPLQHQMVGFENS